MIGKLLINLLAISKSNQVGVYFVNMEAPRPWLWKHSQRNGTGLSLPTSSQVMMEQTSNRFGQCMGESRFTVICPWELRALWFPRLMKLTIQLPVRILSS